MTKNTQTLIEEIKSAPENVQKEVLDFLLFLKSKAHSNSEKADDLLPLAQSAWAADWDSPEEDEAWRDL
jgi:hypothetical protein